MDYMTNLEVGKCIELGRKYLDIDPDNIIKCICSEYGINEGPKIKKTDRLELVAKVVCDYLNEDIKELLTPKGNRSGRQELNRIRQIFSLIAYNDYDYSYEKIGKYLLRDHVSIMIAEKKAENFYNQEPQFKTDVDSCRNLIEKAIIIGNIGIKNPDSLVPGHH